MPHQLTTHLHSLHLSPFAAAAAQSKCPALPSLPPRFYTILVALPDSVRVRGACARGGDDDHHRDQVALLTRDASVSLLLRGGLFLFFLFLQSAIAIASQRGQAFPCPLSFPLLLCYVTFMPSLLPLFSPLSLLPSFPPSHSLSFFLLPLATLLLLSCPLLPS